jgi:rhamnosyltransferase subunit B
MRVLLLTIGSAGDVHPFIGLGLALRERGHEAKIITNPYFGEVAHRVGLDLVPLGKLEQFREALANPDLWHHRRGTQFVFKIVLDGLRETYDAVAANDLPGQTVLVSSSLGFAGRIAQDKLGIPTATVHLSPSQFRSVIAPPKLPGFPMANWFPTWLKKSMWANADKLFIDPMLAPGINALRAELGLEPVTGILRDFWNSPQRVIGLFPDWFGSPQADWPAQTRLTGFPRYDEANACKVDPQLERFLAEGDKPIVFTPGSAMHHGHAFFTASVAACQRLGRRGLLLTRHKEQIPTALPASIAHFAYAPFSRVFPRAAALVHHGGIGTSAQALAAGCPQLVTPFAHDQFDNADRLVKLGVGRSILARKYTARSASRELEKLLSNPSTASACAAYAARFTNDDSVTRTCELIEELSPASHLQTPPGLAASAASASR